MTDEIRWGVEAFRWVSTLLAAGFGAWLSVRFLPLRAKQDEWKWRRRIDAQEFVFNNLSEISYVGHNLIKSEIDSAVSMAGLDLQKTEVVIFDNVKKIHKRSRGLSLFLSEQQNDVLKQFMDETQEVLDEAKSSWGQWDQGDDEAEEGHRVSTIGKLEAIATGSLKEMDKAIQPEYQ